MENIAAVVIPVYKSILNSNEVVSLKRCFEAFAGSPIILAAPETLDCTAYEKHGRFQEIVRFPDHYFTSTKNYSILLCRSLFYRRFLDFSHILIYQLDAFVFENNLEEWCATGYDYIGAPWMDPYWIEEWFAGHRYLRFMRKRINPVGNGGFSLRNVASFHRVARRLRPFSTLFKNEDFFWSNFVTRFVPSFKIAPLGDAIRFAFEDKPQILFEKNGNKLPFGCHAWEKYDIAFWRPHFRKYGYKI